MNGTVLGTYVGALAADGIALAVAFGANLNDIQQAAILTFVGAVTSTIAAGVTWLEGRKLAAKASLGVAHGYLPNGVI